MLAVAVMLSTGTAVTVDVARLITTPARHRSAVVDLLEQVASVVRAMNGSRTIATQRNVPTLAAALRPAPSPVDETILPASSDAYHPQLLNLPPPTHALSA